MYTVQRIYDYRGATAGCCPVFIDRLYPRGISKERMQNIVWLKTVTPSAGLRRWYHQAPETRYAEFAALYLAELQDETRQKAIAKLRTLADRHFELRLLTAVKNPQRSHAAVLLEYLGEPFQAV